MEPGYKTGILKRKERVRLKVGIIVPAKTLAANFNLWKHCLDHHPEALKTAL